MLLVRRISAGLTAFLPYSVVSPKGFYVVLAIPTMAHENSLSQNDRLPFGAERRGFEPLCRFRRQHAFQACLLSHSSISPVCNCNPQRQPGCNFAYYFPSSITTFFSSSRRRRFSPSAFTEATFAIAPSTALSAFMFSSGPAIMVVAILPKVSSLPSCV